MLFKSVVSALALAAVAVAEPAAPAEERESK